eukprot:scaffold224752_cov18-Tisochrysis_lutea.AAC.1
MHVELLCQLASAEKDSACQILCPKQVSQLHHLVSTTSQPGIFNSPYAIATGSVPFIAGAPVEEHLKQVSAGAIDAGGAGVKPVLPSFLPSWASFYYG